MTSQFKIAWIGAGKMGLPICQLLKSAGHDVTVLARRPEQALKLAEAGFQVETEVRALVDAADVVFTCVPDDKALAEVILNDTFKLALPKSVTVIDMSTVSPSVSAAVAADIPSGVQYLRAPVSGSTQMAETGTLTALVSGPKQAFDAMEAVFRVFTKQAFYLGEAEEARYLKLAINSMIAATAVLLGEALAVGATGGLSSAAMLDVITQSAIASPLIGYKKDMIVCGDYTPAASLSMLLKDINLFLAAGEAQGISLPAGRLVKQIYETAASQGLAESDFFVLVREAARGSSGA